MKRKPFPFRFKTILVILLTVGLCAPSFAQERAPLSLDMVIKISRLEQVLATVDKLSRAAGTLPSKSPVTLFKGMLQGTAWIDPERLIVITVDYATEKPVAIAMIPFKERNDMFQAAFNASRGLDYYIFTIPADQKSLILPKLETAMVEVSRAKAPAGIAVEILAANLLKQHDARIKKGLNQINALATAAKSPSPGPGPTPKEIVGALTGMLEIAKEIELLTVAFDINDRRLSTRVTATASPGGRLAGLFVREEPDVLLGSYLPDVQMITFRTKPFEIEGFGGLLNTAFGPIYQSMGIDLPGLLKLAGHFTGEAAGGFSLGRTSYRTEMISVLKDGKKAPDFLKSTFLPWVLQYGETMKTQFETRFQTQLDPIFVKTPDSTVSGHAVLGLKMKTPVVHPPAGPTQAAGGPEDLPVKMMTSEMRLATVENLLLAAPDDQSMAGLIDTAKNLRKRPPRGTLMAVDVDMEAYIKAMADMFPAMPGGGKNIPELNKMTYRFDLKDGRATGSFAVETEDMLALLSYFKQAVGQTGAPKPPPPKQKRPSPPKPPAATEKKMTPAPPATPPPKPVADQKTKAPLTENDSAFWVDRGSSVSMHGNDRAALAYFEKAIELNPASSTAYFQKGVSLGELGKFEPALAAIDRAIALDPDRGVYYYGRGRIHLLAGNPEKAFEDLTRAADLGNPDAISYLEKHRRASDK